MKTRRTFTTRCLALALGACVLGAPSAAAADEVVIVLNKKNPTKSMSVAEAKAIFLGNTTRWQGVVPIKVVSRGKGKADAFYTDVLGMSATKFDSHWTKRQLAGKGVKPKTAASASDLAAEIGKNPGAVGFALKSELDGVDTSKLRVITAK